MFDVVNILSCAVLSRSAAALAQLRNGLTNEDRSQIFFWLGVISVIGVALVIGGFILYRKLRKGTVSTEEEAGFSISQMRRLYEAGELSHEEYVHLREKLLAASRASMLGEPTDAKLSAAPAATSVAAATATPAPAPVEEAAPDDDAVAPGDAFEESETPEPPTPSQ